MATYTATGPDPGIAKNTTDRPRGSGVGRGAATGVLVTASGVGRGAAVSGTLVTASVVGWATPLLGELVGATVAGCPGVAVAVERSAEGREASAAAFVAGASSGRTVTTPTTTPTTAATTRIPIVRPEVTAAYGLHRAH